MPGASRSCPHQGARAARYSSIGPREGREGSQLFLFLGGAEPPPNPPGWPVDNDLTLPPGPPALEERRAAPGPRERGCLRHGLQAQGVADVARIAAAEGAQAPAASEQQRRSEEGHLVDEAGGQERAE